MAPFIEEIEHQGFAAWRMQNRHGAVTVSAHGGQLLSWRLPGQREVLWLSPLTSGHPAPIRGGVPICWPWFSKQGVTPDAPQHGTVRTQTWRLTSMRVINAQKLQLNLEPIQPQLFVAAAKPTAHEGNSEAFAMLDVSVQFTLQPDSLTQTLTTRNRGTTPCTLTQAFHTYLAVSDARQVVVKGLDGLAYVDKLLGGQTAIQTLPFDATPPCDRVYDQATGHYVLIDALWKRRIVINSTGSKSVVVWNPGSVTATKMADIGPQGWLGFYCVEVANAGADCVVLAPGAEHALTQRLVVENFFSA